MIKSMTGFGRCEIAEENRKITIEMKSVNHRYLDVNIKMPKKFSAFENSIRNLIKEYTQRGKVDVFVTYEEFGEEKFELVYNEELAAAYVEHLNHMAEKFQIPNDITVSTLSRYPEIFTMEQREDDADELWAITEKALRGACDQFVETRMREGEHLRDDLLQKLSQMITYVDFIEERSPQILQEYRQKLETKIQEVLGDRQLDDARVATEVTIFADKICVDEETVRLRSHIEAMRDALLAGGSIGRRLDFIAQEMNREANTILSKTSDLAVSDIGISLKTDIEKVREQIQNIE